jgi:predicted transcriptional regulator
MKVAVSIPDDVFDDAEEMARQLRTSRSNLYARALAEFVKRRAPDRITQAINAVIDEVGTQPDGFTKAAARRALERSEW